MVAKRDHQGPILARVGIGDRRDLGAGDRTARIVEQRGVQAALGDARIRRRRKLRPREISLEELIGNKEPAAVATVEQMMPAGEPEIGHAIVASTTYRWPSIPQHGNRDGVSYVGYTESARAAADNAAGPRGDPGHWLGVRVVHRCIGTALSQ